MASQTLQSSTACRIAAGPISLVALCCVALAGCMDTSSSAGSITPPAPRAPLAATPSSATTTSTGTKASSSTTPTKPANVTMTTLPTSGTTALTTLILENRPSNVSTGTALYDPQRGGVVIGGETLKLTREISNGMSYVRGLEDIGANGETLVVLQGPPKPSGSAVYRGKAIIVAGDRSSSIIYGDGTGDAVFKYDLATGKQSGVFKMTNGFRQISDITASRTPASGGTIKMDVDANNKATFDVSGMPGVTYNSAAKGNARIVYAGPKAEEVAGIATGDDSNTLINLIFTGKR